MPERSKKRPRDPNELAYQIMLESTGQAPKYDPNAEEKPVDPSKNPHAVALGRLGGLKGASQANTSECPASANAAMQTVIGR